jgi:hypothetical protein
MMKESLRVLKAGGRYIYITFGQPHFRKKLFLKEEYPWELEKQITFGTFSKLDSQTGDGFHYFIYIFKKK